MKTSAPAPLEPDQKIAKASSPVASQQQSAFVDTRPVATAQRKLAEMANAGAQVRQHQAMAVAINRSPHVVQQKAMAERIATPKRNNTGLPDQLKSGIESLSGMSMDHVKVHYQSPEPVQLNALAYAQGSNIHVAPGQEKHLPHEAWHVVQQAQGRVRPTMQAKGVQVNDDQNLEHEADVMGSKALLAREPDVQLQSRTAGLQALHSPGAAPAQRQAGIPSGTHVAVNDGTHTWYGQISAVSDANATYAVRVGGTDRVVDVPQAQVDYHDTVVALAPERVAMERWVDALPTMNIGGDMAAFGGGGLAAQIVTAHGNMTKLQGTAAHTIAMFEYMDRHAAAIGGRILQDFLTVPFEKRTAYLDAMSAAMVRKIQRMLWIGGDDKGMVAAGGLDPTAYFSEGRNHLLAKAQAALLAGKTLVALLEDHSDNMDAKSYGRRQESMQVLNIGGLPGAVAAPPLAGVPVPHNQAGYVYIADDYITVVAAVALVANTDYILRINNGPGIPVTVQVNGPLAVTFSAVG